MTTWEERMSQRARDREQARYDAQYRQWVIDAGPRPSENPPDAPACCFEWRLDRNHWLLFKTCGDQRPECAHAHHEGEVWLANSFEFLDGAEIYKR